ncbi:MAG: hypothetical protein Salg2KO_23220 [Salibacteraceae bacterium]
MKRWAFLTWLVIYGCNPSNDSSQKNGNAAIDSATATANMDSGLMITLPTPMQVPTLLKTSRADYRREAMLPIVNQEKSFFKSNLLFGAYLIDMAYAGAFQDQQTALVYLKKCNRLAIDMGLGTEVDEDLVNRFERHIDKPDTIGRIILELYELGHAQFAQSGREGIGLIMIMGCVMEGVHLSINELSERDLIQFSLLVEQQIHYIDNLILALDEYEIPLEITREFEILQDLSYELNAMKTVEIVDGERRIHVNPRSLKRLKTLVNEFRLSILV